MSLLETDAMPRRVMTVFFLVDTSGSMDGNKIASLNDAIVNVIPTLREISDANNDAEIRIAALRFSSGAEWMTSEPQPLDTYRWQDLDADGLTSMGEAFARLEEKMHRNGGFMSSPSGSLAPVLILLSDGEPTDNYRDGLQKLKGNNWYKNAIKVAIAIGNDANKDVLKEFTNNIEAVFTVHNVDALKTIIRVATVTSSTIGSQSTNTGDQSKQDQVIDSINDQVNQLEDVAIDSGSQTSTTDDDW